MNSLNDISQLLRERVSQYTFDTLVYEYGTVVSSGDGVIHIEGLAGRKYGELLECSGGSFAMALELSEDTIGAVVLSAQVQLGEEVRGTGRIMEVPVGDMLLGRVVDPLGQPLDMGKPLQSKDLRPIECVSAKILEREAVNQSLPTGLLAIDTMIPIGRGQRELIIGDRQTGKTTIAIDTILNQKDTNVLCIYCAIGQKASTVAQIVKTLSDCGAMEYTVVVAATASDSAALQYVAPYAACTIGEAFMYAGKDVLVVYDDLSKHAVAYRTMALLLHRPPGREAYPGDVFYLHSRLLERSAHLSKELGGGSLTALPIIETMAGDISAYIPTNVISITDGQIFLESELFNAGMRPAINVGLSVSRVGRSAQKKAMRDVSGTLRMDLAQYREMAIFTQFGSDLDSTTKFMLEKGIRQNEALKQKKHSPYKLSHQVALLLALNVGALKHVPVETVVSFNRDMLSFLDKECEGEMNIIDMTGELEAGIKQAILRSIHHFAQKYDQMMLKQLEAQANPAEAGA